MKITLNKQQQNSAKVRPADLMSQQFFRAISSVCDREYVYIKLNDYVYRCNHANTSVYQMLQHIRSDNTDTYFTDVYYLDVELIGRDNPQ